METSPCKGMEPKEDPPKKRHGGVPFGFIWFPIKTTKRGVPTKRTGLYDVVFGFSLEDVLSNPGLLLVSLFVFALNADQKAGQNPF